VTKISPYSFSDKVSFSAQFLREACSLAAKIKHVAERGRLNEKQLEKILRQVLPRKMEIGTGFIACSDASKELSAQQDLIIFDALNNSTLLDSDVFGIYPIEAVYGTLEVKTTLNKTELKKSFKSNGYIRKMAKSVGKYYFKNKRKKRGKIYVDSPSNIRVNVAPRFFLFAYSFNQKFETLEKNFKELSKKYGSHCHGLCVLKNDWFFAHDAGTDEIKAFREDGFFIFIVNLIKALSTMDIGQADFLKYAKILDSSLLAKDTNGEVIGIELPQGSKASK
jgi:hypothetical protein